MAAAACLAAAACRQEAGHQLPAPARLTNVVVNGMTPVKDQGSNGNCWAYAMLAAIETEHLTRGDSVNLSADYAMRALTEELFARLYLCQGHTATSLRGMAQTLLNVMQRKGMMPYDSYRADPSPNCRTIARKVGLVARAAVARRTGLERSMPQVAQLLDDAYGPLPRRVYMLGAEYTPQEFGRSVCAPGEYVALTSYTHHPFGQPFALELPDNWEHNEQLNVPLDSLVGVMRRAVAAGRGVCWEGDVSDPGFSFRRGVARLRPGTDTSQGARQRAFERFETTDDHCMAVVGLARDARGERYFVMKNSWGTRNPYGGLMYVSEDYVRLRTVAIVVPRALLQAPCAARTGNGLSGAGGAGAPHLHMAKDMTA